MKTNKILLTTLLLSSLTLVSCGENNETSNSTSSNTTDSSLSSSTKPELTEAEKQEKIYTTFKDAVMKEFDYRGSKSLSIDAKLAGEPHVFDGETELTAEEIKSLNIEATPMKADIKQKSSYDKESNTYVATSYDAEKEVEKLDEYYYTENGQEFRCFETTKTDPETNEKVVVSNRESLDSGHINTVAFMKPAEQIEILTGAKTFDELLENAKGMLTGIPLLSDTVISESKIDAKDTETGHEASIKLVASTKILGQIGVSADVTGVLKYTDDKIESFVVTGTGTFSTKENKNNKDYTIKQNLTIEANVVLSRSYTELADATRVAPFKAATAVEAKKQQLKCTSIFGTDNLIVKDGEFVLPQKIQDLKHCDVKAYKDKDHKEEVALYTLEKKSYEQEPIYIDIKPQFGYALVIETQNDPSGFGMNTIKYKELKTIDNKYEYLEKIELDSDWFGNNGKPWTDVTLNGEKVAAGTKELALENGKIYKVEYTYTEPKE